MIPDVPPQENNRSLRGYRIGVLYKRGTVDDFGLSLGV